MSKTLSMQGNMDELDSCKDTYTFFIQCLILLGNLLFPGSTLVSTASSSELHIDRSFFDQGLVEEECFL
jgi:hypothetical protein